MNPTLSLQLISFIADGLTAREIAARINKSPRTVEAYLKMMRVECGARNTSHMVAVYFRNNWIY